jgi:hypothetical protein
MSSLEQQPTEINPEFKESQEQTLEGINSEYEHLKSEADELLAWEQALDRFDHYVRYGGADQLIRLFGSTKFVEALQNAQKKASQDDIATVDIIRELEPDQDKRKELYGTLISELDQRAAELEDRSLGRREEYNEVMSQRNMHEAAKIMDVPTEREWFASQIRDVLNIFTNRITPDRVFAENWAAGRLVGETPSYIYERLAAFIEAHQEDIIAGIKTENNRVDSQWQTWEQSKSELVPKIKEYLLKTAVEIELAHKPDQDVLMNDIRQFALLNDKAQTPEAKSMALSGIADFEKKAEALHAQIDTEIEQQAPELAEKLKLLASTSLYL